LEGKSEEKAGMSVGLRERERERRSFCDDRERERRAKEEEKESKRSRGERAACGQIQVPTTLSVFEASFERKASIHVSPALGLARS
jgi:hypothetical protein